MKYSCHNQFQPSAIKSFTILMVFGLMTVLFAGCSSSTSANDEEGGDSNNQTRTFDIMLSAESSTKVGTANTEIITEESDAYIDDGFFITLDISDSEFEAPFDISMKGGLVRHMGCSGWRRSRNAL